MAPHTPEPPWVWAYGEFLAQITLCMEFNFIIFRNTSFRIFLNLNAPVKQMEHYKEAPSLQGQGYSLSQYTGHVPRGHHHRLVIIGAKLRDGPPSFP